MHFLQESYKISSKILQDNALFSQTSFKNLGSIASFLQVSSKILRVLARFFQESLYSFKFLARLALTSQFILLHNMYQLLSYVMCFLLQKCYKNLTVASKQRFWRRFRKRKELSFPKGRDIVTLDKNCFILYSCSDKLSHYKTYVVRKFLIPNAFKDVRLQNTFNRCRVHQILPLTVDYACSSVKS